MNNRMKKIRLIGTILIALFLIIYIITNVRIRSVNGYRHSLGITENESGTDSDANSSIGGTNETEGADPYGTGSGDSDSIGIGSTDGSSSNDDSSSTGSSGSENSDSTGSSGSDSIGIGSTDGSSSSDNSGSTGNSGSESSGSGNSQNTATSKNTVTCTIEIRCDNAVKRKSTITNEGIKKAIPDDGTILGVTTYSGEEGYSVYDVLAYVTAANGIPIVASSDKSYVSSINNLAQMNVGPTSGWTYRVNGELVMKAAVNCTVEEGDAIKWIYVCEVGDT